MGSTSLDSRVLSSAELRVSGESMEKGVITADVATHEEVALRAMQPWDRTDGLVLGLSQGSVRLLVHAVQQRAPTPKDLELSCRCPACDRGLSLGARTDLLSVRDRQTDSGKAFRSGDLTDTSR